MKKICNGLLLGVLIACAALGPTLALAQSEVISNQGSPGKRGPWSFQGVAGGVAAPVLLAPFSNCVQTEVLVLASASTAVPATPLVGRRAFEIQVLAPNQIFCTASSAGTAAVLNKARRINADPTAPWAVDGNDSILVKCIAATADQVTGAATIITECK